MIFARPWEASEQMLADAGVELGVTYPYPVVTLAESEKHLKIAAKVIHETLAASMAAPQVQHLAWMMGRDWPRHGSQT